MLKECNEAEFALLEKGPSVLNVKKMEEKLSNIHSKQAVSHTPFVDGGNKYRYDHTTEKRKLSFVDKSFIHGKT